MEKIYQNEDEIAPYYQEITAAYVAAFAGKPWYEVSKCPNPSQQTPDCTGGAYCRMASGDFCGICEQRITEPAYTPDGLVDGWRQLYRQVERPIWYLERVADEKVALAALAWRTDAEQLGRLRYADN